MSAKSVKFSKGSKSISSIEAILTVSHVSRFSQRVESNDFADVRRTDTHISIYVRLSGTGDGGFSEKGVGTSGTFVGRLRSDAEFYKYR